MSKKRNRGGGKGSRGNDNFNNLQRRTRDLEREMVVVRESTENNEIEIEALGDDWETTFEAVRGELDALRNRQARDAKKALLEISQLRAGIDGLSHTEQAPERGMDRAQIVRNGKIAAGSGALAVALVEAFQQVLQLFAG